MNAASHDTKGVSLTVKRKGCNGLGYQIDYQKSEPKPLDEKVEFSGSDQLKGSLFIEANSVMHLLGTEVDYEENELSSEFTFNNPNQKGVCECGESFTV